MRNVDRYLLLAIIGLTGINTVELTKIHQEREQAELARATFCNMVLGAQRTAVDTLRVLDRQPQCVQ